MYSRARAAKGAQVSLSMATSDSRRSDQSAIWDEIASKSERLAASSPTQAMKAMYDSKAVPLDAYLGAFAWAEHQAGVVFAFGSETMGLDLMDHPHTMRAMLPKLVRSYALDAVEAPHASAAGTSGAAEFLARVGKSDPLIRKAVGMGEDVRLTREGISGAALWAKERYIHLCAFTTNGTGGPGGFRTSISRPARRRAR
jgi:hypothetical protein